MGLGESDGVRETDEVVPGVTVLDAEDAMLDEEDGVMSGVGDVVGET